MGNITAVIKEGSAANYLDPLGWIGSLEEFSYDDGYWFILESDAMLEVSGHSIMPDYQYDLSNGANLISFSFNPATMILWASWPTLLATAPFFRLKFFKNPNA